MQKLIERIKEDLKDYESMNASYEGAAIYHYLKRLLDDIESGEVSE